MTTWQIVALVWGGGIIVTTIVEVLLALSQMKRRGERNIKESIKKRIPMYFGQNILFWPMTLLLSPKVWWDGRKQDS